MRHKKRGRVLGRSPSHRKAMLRNLACSLILTEREVPELEQALGVEPPKVKGRVVTTVAKAKEVRPLIEKCITIARNSIPHEEAAREHETDAERNTEAWQQWRNSDEWRQWTQAKAPAVAARRRVLRMLRNRDAVEVLFDEIAPRFEGRPGGYTRIVRLAAPRLGDAGPRAILEFVGKRDRVVEKSEAPAFEDTEEKAPPAAKSEEAAAEESAEEQAAAEGAEASQEESGEEEEKKEE